VASCREADGPHRARTIHTVLLMKQLRCLARAGGRGDGRGRLLAGFVACSAFSQCSSRLIHDRRRAQPVRCRWRRGRLLAGGGVRICSPDLRAGMASMDCAQSAARTTAQEQETFFDQLRRVRPLAHEGSERRRIRSCCFYRASAAQSFSWRRRVGTDIPLVRIPAKLSCIAGAGGNGSRRHRADRVADIDAIKRECRAG